MECCPIFVLLLGKPPTKELKWIKDLMQVWLPCYDHSAWTLLGWEGMRRKQKLLIFTWDLSELSNLLSCSVGCSGEASSLPLSPASGRQNPWLLRLGRSLWSKAGRTPPKLVLFFSGEFGLGLAVIAVGRAFPSWFFWDIYSSLKSEPKCFLSKLSVGAVFSICAKGTIINKCLKNCTVQVCIKQSFTN